MDLRAASDLGKKMRVLSQFLDSNDKTLFHQIREILFNCVRWILFADTRGSDGRAEHIRLEMQMIDKKVIRALCIEVKVAYHISRKMSQDIGHDDITTTNNGSSNYMAVVRICLQWPALY